MGVSINSKLIKLLKILRKLILFPIAVIISIVSTIVTIVTIVLSPILILPIIPYKFYILILSKCFIPDAKKILRGSDNFMALGCVYKSSNFYVSIPQVFEGRLELDKVILETQKRVIDKQRKDGTLQFPELQYHVETFLGFSFFRPDKTFDLKNHVKVYDNKNEIVDKKRLHKIREEVGRTLFAKKRSPWEIVIVNNYRKEGDDKEYSILIWKIHHCMGDGNAAVQIIFSSFGEIPPLHIPQFGKTFNEKLLFTLKTYWDFVIMIANISFDVIYNPFRLFDFNSWQKAIAPKDLYSVLWSPEPIDVNVVKEISVANKVSITSVLMSSCVGAFRRMMESKGVSTPKDIRCCFSYNLPDPGDGLTCNSLMAYFNLPLSRFKESREFTKIINRQLITASAIGYKVMSHIMLLMANYAPVSFSFRRPVKTSFTTCGFSSFPMPSLDVELANCKLIENYSNIELMETSVAVSVYCIKYKNQFCITFAIQRKLLGNDEEIYDIEKYFVEEFNALKATSLTV